MSASAARGPTTRRGRWTLEDRAESVLREVPFDVPGGTALITVRLSYDRRRGVLDLGCLGPDGEFRGWSGGARDTFTIGADRATPGYLPGEPLPGTWRVLLRLHRIPADGLDYEVTTRTGDRAAEPPEEDPWPAPGPPPPRRGLPEVDGMRWLAGDLHAHTLHSDGSLTIPRLASLAASVGLDYLAVTDHNTVSHHPVLPAAGRRYGITLLPGQEVTTDTGHANVFGDTGWIDFRRPADDWARAAEAAGGVMSVNHPVAGDCAWRQPLSARPRLAELWHHSWTDRRDGAPLAWAGAWPKGPSDGDGIVPVGGSDFHSPEQGRLPGQPTTWLLTEGDDVLGALKAGRTAISAGVDAPLLLRCGAEFLALDADGTVLVAPDGRGTVVRGDRALLPAGPGTHRLESPVNEVVAVCA